MKRSTGVVYLIALAQRIQIVPLARVLVSRHLQRVQHATEFSQRRNVRIKPLKLGIDESHVEWRVVNN